MCLSHDRTLYLQRIYVCLLLNTMSRHEWFGKCMELNLLAAPILALCFMFSMSCSNARTHTHTHNTTTPAHTFLLSLSVAYIYVVSVSHSLQSLCALMSFAFCLFQRGPELIKSCQRLHILSGACQCTVDSIKRCQHL